MTIPALINYQFATSTTLPPIAGKMMEYWVAGNGVFVRAARQGLSACIPVNQCSIRGLPHLTPYFHLQYPLVPASLVLKMLQQSLAVGYQEILFYLCFTDGEWYLHIPEQTATSTSVTPVEATSLSYQTAMIEVHSHHSMSAQFSATDDEEESGKFRIFAVLGEIFTNSHICVRLGAYSHFWQIPANWIFELPSCLTDVMP
jgi:PRTRC genetic system protein A